MKKMTCRDMGGSCDAEITGNSPEEMMENGKNHVHGTDDDAHKELVEKMKAVTPEQFAEWEKGFRAKYDAAPDA